MAATKKSGSTKKPAASKKVVAKKDAAPKVAKVTKTTMKKAKEEVATITLMPAAKLVKSIIGKHKLTVPPVEEMFADQIAMGLPMVPLHRIALFNNADDFVGHKGVLMSAMDDVAGNFGSNNFLNLSAELEPKNVERVLKLLLEFGSLIQVIKVCTVDETTIPTNIKDKTGVDVCHLQCWDGRHRLAALAMLYGENLEVPVQISSFTYTKALFACVNANDTRPIKKLEAIHYEALKDGPNPQVAYAKKEGKFLPIAKWIASHVLQQHPEPQLKALVKVRVQEKVNGIKGISAVNFTNTLRNCLGALGTTSGFYHSTKLTADTKAAFNTIVKIIQTIFLAIDTQSQGAKASTAWNAYSSPLIGKLIGRAILNWTITNTPISDDVIDDFAGKLATILCGFMEERNPEGELVYARTPVSPLYDMFTKYADKQGISLTSTAKPLVHAAATTSEEAAE